MFGDLPTPLQWFRKHAFDNGNYETLTIFYVPERVFEGRTLPRILRCIMFGSLAPQQELSAPDIEAGQMLLDAVFSKRFPEHQCSEECTASWSKPVGENGSSPEGEEPINPTIQ